MKITTIVRADRMYLASLFQGKKETRYYLNGVYVHQHAGGINVAATDGHTMAVLREDVGMAVEPQIIALPKAALQVIQSKRADSKSHWLVITDEGARSRRRGYIFRHVLSDEEHLADVLTAELSNVVSLAEAWSGIVEIIDGTFPNYISVIPEIGERSGTPAIQARYMDRFTKVATFRGNAMPAMGLWARDQMAPVLVDIADQDDFVGVVMPVRCELRGPKMPAWAQKDVSASEPKVSSTRKARVTEAA
ncbi:beta clamp domain-containing protein [Tanticharoenia sakaeratensis]|uniref:Uncharacterized protein n=1 Tax=Tanticharoenia sakaeratensis NBRC 103193 TaxID=1231623 RepID=A0A0D6MP52_9PROT|nr:hypothetical protein [Tanticharoenia sakaeratensis]GAN55221.1 hypothetical protein Tasa_041_016 [Tanticharoenia sakaeratensis NBRC 103193]GBQ23281.1 hypothetical protein AA103193_2359 [Tanticharoenia sakaeratensis NBRC 103193]